MTYEKPSVESGNKQKKMFCVREGRAKPAPHARKTLFQHGARTSGFCEGADPSAAKVLVSSKTGYLTSNLDSGLSRMNYRG